MRSKLTVAGLAVVALLGMYLLGCGSSSPASPSPMPGGGGGGGGGGTAAVTISIVGMSGPQAFSPNPASVPVGQTVRFVNNDSTTHHIVQDGGAFDVGNLAPGASSAPVTITSAGSIPYHCTIHPDMVGSITGTR